MRFALLGDHSDGIDFAYALASSGRHEVVLYSGPAEGLTRLARRGLRLRSVGDLEEVLADPVIDAVIVASGPAQRRGQLLRALRSECHVLCVHPADNSPDVAYEASLIQADTGRVLMPLLPMALHPGVARLRELAGVRTERRVLELEIWSHEEVLLDALSVHHKPGFPGWDLLRAVGGEIAEVFAQSTRAEVATGEPVTVNGRLVGGLVFQASYLPQQVEARLRLALVTTTGRTSLEFDHGWPGAARLTWIDENGERQEEMWPSLDPWQPLLERFELAVLTVSVQKPPVGRPADECLTRTPPLLGWHDELRGLELDDAARRSIERGRSSLLDLQEVNEEASFKGTMTLVGCSLIWLAVVVLILSFWVPWLAWGIVPVFAVFLGMQALRWILPEKPASRDQHQPID